MSPALLAADLRLPMADQACPILMCGYVRDLVHGRPRTRHPGFQIQGEAMLDALRRFFRLSDSNRFAAVIALLVAIMLYLPAEAGGWVVVFQDNFSQSALDTKAWYTRYIYNNGTM